MLTVIRADCHLCRVSYILSVAFFIAMLNVIMLSVVMLYVIMPNDLISSLVDA